MHANVFFAPIFFLQKGFELYAFKQLTNSGLLKVQIDHMFFKKWVAQ